MASSTFASYSISLNSLKAYLVMDKVTFICLAVATLCEPVFLARVKALCPKTKKSKYKKPKIKLQ